MDIDSTCPGNRLIICYILITIGHDNEAIALTRRGEGQLHGEGFLLLRGAGGAVLDGYCPGCPLIKFVVACLEKNHVNLVDLVLV